MSFIDRFRGKKSTAPKAAPVKEADVKAVAPKKKTAPKAAEETVLKAEALKRPELLSLVRGPRASEKAARSGEKGVYVFNVSLLAEKIAIRKAIESLYKVNVEQVRTIRVKGKPVRRGRRVSARSDAKKAIVTLKKGQTINLYEGA